jgi:hypothetical protein
MEGLKIRQFESQQFQAQFSSIAFKWEITLDDMLFWIRHLGIKEDDKYTYPKNKFQLIKAEKVLLEVEGDVATLTRHAHIEKISQFDELFNPDQPRNLAKSVTVP